MSGERDDGGPAFPAMRVSAEEAKQIDWLSSGGMTLRDRFAEAALPALVAWTCPESHPVTSAVMRKQALSFNMSLEDYTATAAYGFADAMLRARAR